MHPPFDSLSLDLSISLYPSATPILPAWSLGSTLSVSHCLAKHPQLKPLHLALLAKPQLRVHLLALSAAL